MADLERVLPRLRSQMTRGQLVLFTGAGFSLGARDRRNRKLPTSVELRDALLGVAYPGEPIDPEGSLGDAFAVAVARNRGATQALLEERLSVDPDSLPNYYVEYFRMPWHRVYTLNIDDLESAVARRFDLTRRPEPISATSPSTGTEGPQRSAQRVEVVHLNGMLGDAPEHWTFSEHQYAERLAGPESWFSRCAADLRGRPVIYIGTELRESALWQHIELRRRQRVESEVLPPGSILVSPSLSRTRRDMLVPFNVEWIEGTAESFADVLAQLRSEAERGFTFLRTYDENFGRPGIPLVSELAAERPTLHTEYLSGDEPQWSDLLSGRAMTRSSDAELLATAEKVINDEGWRAAIAVTGTAGAGKSTALMRVALELSNRGLPALWIDRDSNAAPATVRKRINQLEGRAVVAIDDADMYGYQLASLLRDLVPTRPTVLFLFAARSSKLDVIAEPLARTEEVQLITHVVPPLSDPDVDNLIAVLDRHHRLGVLKGKSNEQRRQAFTDKCGRQLLVAMIEATSGQRFEEKAATEFQDLQGASRFVYAALAIATTQRHFLLRDEILLACSGLEGEPLDALQKLLSRHLVVAPPPTNQHRIRHRVIAEIVFQRLVDDGQAAPVIKALAFALSSKSTQDRRDRVWKLLVRLINHNFLIGTMDLQSARDVYQEVESLVSADYHFWLQRGSLEVEHGDLRRAEQFLDQARSLAAYDYRVDTEYAYLLFRKGIEAPADVHAPKWVEQATQLLEGVIGNRGDQDSYPYHVMGSQGLAWSRRRASSKEERRRALAYYMHVVGQGIKKHPKSRDLKTLHADLQTDYLTTAVPGNRRA